MTKRTSTAISYLLWAIGLVPASLLALWLGMVPWSWGGFFTAYVILAVVSLTFDTLQRWIARLLQRRRERSGASVPKH